MSSIGILNNRKSNYTNTFLQKFFLTGNTIVEFFSAAIVDNVCKYLNCNAVGDWLMTSAAALSAIDAFCSPSAATTLALASRPASASVAIARCILAGKRTSLLEFKKVT